MFLSAASSSHARGSARGSASSFLNSPAFTPPITGRGRDFVAALDAFLAQLPQGWPYAIEMRNPQWLQQEYFDCLSRHRIAHVYNSWTEMPQISDQMALPCSRTNPELVAARFLLKPGRKYQDAVKSFQPYDQTKEVNAEARQAGAALIREGKTTRGGKPSSTSTTAWKETRFTPSKPWWRMGNSKWFFAVFSGNMDMASSLVQRSVLQSQRDCITQPSVGPIQRGVCV